MPQPNTTEATDWLDFFLKLFGGSGALAGAWAVLWKWRAKKAELTAQKEEAADKHETDEATRITSEHWKIIENHKSENTSMLAAQKERAAELLAHYKAQIEDLTAHYETRLRNREALWAEERERAVQEIERLVTQVHALRDASLEAKEAVQAVRQAAVETIEHVVSDLSQTVATTAAALKEAGVTIIPAQSNAVAVTEGSADGAYQGAFEATREQAEAGVTDAAQTPGEPGGETP